MSNYDYIRDKNFANISPEERKEAARKGGIKSGETRRRKRLMAEEADLLLSKKCKSRKGQEVLAEIGAKSGSYQMAAIAQQILKAVDGDLDALTWLRDILGEKPAEKLESNVRTLFGFADIEDDITG